MGLSSLTASDALASLLLVVAAGATVWYVGRLLVALVLVLVARRRPRYRRWALHCAPAALRPLLARALLGGLLTAGLTGTASWADPAASCPPDAGAVPLLDRADLCAAAQPDSPAGAAATDPPASQPTGQDGQRAQATYSVRSGDSLWTIAEGLLGGDPPASAIAEAWPALWQANRAIIGDDPGLILPGTELAVPTALQAARTR